MPQSTTLRRAAALMAYTIAASAQGTELTIDRLFEAPALSGPAIAALKIAPNSSRITFLKGKDTDKDRLDLWEYDVGSGAARILVDSKDLKSGTDALSDEEKARRERQRTAALSGIVEYDFSPKGDALLFPLGGDLFYYSLASSVHGGAATQIPTQGFVTDPSISPAGSYVAYIRDQNLVLYDLATKHERALTNDGGGLIKNGMAEFVAQEEMDRSTGYWWAPDDRHIAFARVDESPVTETQRFEIAADNVKTFAQRYPAAGEANVSIQVGVVDVASGKTVWMDLGQNKDIYVARVDWLPDGKTLAIQRESRDQKKLDLLFADVATGRSHVVLTETSDSWIELNNELSFLKHSRQFIWASSRSGFTHLYLYGSDGVQIRQLTHGDWNVEDFRRRAIKGIDEKKRVLYFTSEAKTPTERHLYRVGLDAGEPHQITQDAGMHDVSMSSNTHFYVDNFNSSAQPPRVGLYGQDGHLQSWLLENKLDSTHPDAAYLQSNAVSEFGTLSASDGQKLYYRLYKPHDFDTSKRYPAIVDVYGGPGVQRVLNSWSGSSFTQILTRAGYVVMVLDNRGSAFRGTAFQSGIHGKLGEIEVADQLVGAKWLAAQNFIDAGQLGVWGWSYGGYMTLMLMFKAPELFKAGISGAPVTDWHLYDTHYTERYLGKPQDNPAGYDASSVIPYAGDLRGRLLVMHGMADDNVLLLNSTKLFRRLQDAGKPFDVMVYPGAKHGLLRQKDGRHAYTMMLRFFEENLAAQRP